jgi:restriction system protein
MSRKRTNEKLPTYDEMLKPVVKALIELGGSGTIEEVNGKVVESLNLEDDVLQIPHGDNEGLSEVEYRLAWSRTYLKKFGLINNSERGVWSLAKPDVVIDALV